MNDDRAYITVKKARTARAGKQIYSAQELYLQGVTLKDEKAFGVVYRPPEMLIRNKDKFANVPFVDNHTPEAVTPENWKKYAIGFVGSSIDVEVFDDEVWLTGDVVFYDRKAYEKYQEGKVEISAGYDTKLGLADDPDMKGYDAVLLDIPAVNHVALCDKARAGPNARVLDSLNFTGGNVMAVKVLGGFLARLGIGKAKDENFKFSKVLMDSVAKVHTLKPDELEKEVTDVMSYVISFGDSEERGLLIGAVSDCFKHPVEVIAKKDEISVKIDELYGKCQDADAKVVDGILGSDKKDKDDKKDEDDDKKKDEAKKSASDQMDFAVLINTAIEKSFASLSDSIGKKIDDSVNKALGLEGGDKKDKGDQRFAADNLMQLEQTDASFLVSGIFGNK